MKITKKTYPGSFSLSRAVGSSDAAKIERAIFHLGWEGQSAKAIASWSCWADSVEEIWEEDNGGDKGAGEGECNGARGWEEVEI